MKRYILLLISILTLTSNAHSNNLKTEAQRFMEILYYIDMMYVDTANINQLTTTAIKKMLGELDPHSQYIEAKDVERSMEHIVGNFEGVGVSYNIIHDTLTVIQAIPGGPSEKVGIFPGDKFISVDGENICGANAKTPKIQKLLRGKKGTKVAVSVVRSSENAPINFIITRDVIPIHSVDASYMIEPGVGYIKLNSYSKTTIDEIQASIAELKAQGMSHLMLDLQSNGGGLLHAAIELVDQFLPAGQLIVYTEGEHQRRSEANATAQGLFENGKITILIDEHSASASEITAGAIQDWDRGTVVGRRSFGKGLVQRPIKLSDGGEVRLTTARYYTPSGRHIQRPYNEGKEKYMKELERRYAHGEYYNADSISFPDSLKYKTLSKGRTVYGGGGIFPDVFVPLDTTEFSSYYRNLFAKGVILSCTADYVDRNREKIEKKYKDVDQYKTKFELNDNFLQDMIDEASKSNIEFNKEEYLKSKELIKLQIKALIARSVYGQESFYKIINDKNEVLQKALELIKE